MHPDAALAKFERTYERWRRGVGSWSDDDLGFVPPRGGWSGGEVVDHVASVSARLLDNALACALGKGETGHRAFLPSLLFAVGTFPPIRIKVTDPPQEVRSLFEPRRLGATEVAQAFDRLQLRMRGSVETIRSAPKDARRRHWTGAWLTARQWYQSVEMHLRHHARQMTRIAKAARGQGISVTW